MSNFQFQVNLSAFIQLLSENLYSDPKVFLREAIQNAVDALHARTQFGHDFEPAIDIETNFDPASGDRRLMISDNGVGLTEGEIHQFLARIASSTKRDAEVTGGYIGQFGIGLLSCFMVAEEIVMITRSAKGGPAYQWTGRVDGTYSVTELQSEQAIGTKMYLTARPDRRALFEEERIKTLVQYFAEYLNPPIRLNNRQVNSGRTPWEMHFPSREMEQQTLLAYGKKAFGEDFMAALPIKTRDGHTDGALFFLPYATRQEGRNRVYLKRMLLTSEATKILPEWASFVKAVINTDRLTPLLSREVFRDDANLTELRQELGETIKAYLRQLANAGDPLLHDILRVHGVALMVLAQRDADLFDALVPLIRFETPLGYMTLPVFARLYGKLPYVTMRADYEQIRSLSPDSPTPMLLLESDISLGFVKEFYKLNPELTLEKLSVGSEMKRLSDTTLMGEDEQRFVVLAEEFLGSMNLKVAYRGFEPPENPVLLAATDALGLSRDMMSQRTMVGTTFMDQVLSSMRNSMKGVPAGEIVFNAHNPMIRKLAAHSSEEVQLAYIQILYLQSLLANHHALRPDELAMQEKALGVLLNRIPA